MADAEIVKEALRRIFSGIELLKANNSSGRKFTIDGRLVGDIGEIIAEREFEITLDEKSRKGHDAKTFDGRDVQVKATFGKSLTFTTEPVRYLGFNLEIDGRHRVVFNGPGHVIRSAFAHRKGIGEKQLSFSISKLEELFADVEVRDQIPLRKG